MAQRVREKEEKQLHINGTEKILLKSCTSTGARNYDQKSCGRLDKEDAWNYLRFRRFLACHISSTVTNIRVMRSSIERTAIS
ncbi:hypothetical protein TNCV_2450721 [Trichonephila clavipes]|nr:hypothetical protein TNCV_2450721 [Trichonephila clavipes]